MKSIDFSVGETAEMTAKATEEIVQAIAELSGDYNPIHVSEQYASETVFGKRIAHGLFCVGLLSKILGMYLPGPGSILMEQTFDYHAPVFIDDEITARVTVVFIQREKGIMELEMVCINQNHQTVLTGKSTMKASSVKRPDCHNERH